MIALALALAVLAATARGPDPLGPEVDVAIGSPAPAPTCAPTLARYPVAGPHNGGYDRNWATQTCAPHPADARDGSDFGRPRHVANDLFAREGTPVVAAAAGTVVALLDAPHVGLGVVVRDNCGWHALYAHLSRVTVSAGAAVAAGDRLGDVGRTGGAKRTAPHLHFALFPERYGAGVDPFPLLQPVDATACTE
ncbi:MAG: M23 family metallopeptidase [Deltaproteobacteria bacterium]|nr:M23 family metallopeptidase [Deltaproteobacteria bacterium]